MIRNFQSFRDLVPTRVLGCIQSYVGGDVKGFAMFVSNASGPLFYRTSETPRVPLVTIWDLRTENEDLVGYFFHVGNQRIQHSATHLLASSPSLCTQFSLDDAQEASQTVLSARTDHFSVFHYSLGATLVSRRANSLMSQLLDKDFHEQT